MNRTLLLDRYRVHVWIQFHHRVVTMKMLVRFLIQAALERGAITKLHFDPSKEEFLFRDDIWLWDVLREMEADTPILEIVQKAVFARQKGNILSLWKTRTAYHSCWNEVREKARRHTINYGTLPSYRAYLTKELGEQALAFGVPFQPLSEQSIPLYEEGRGLTKVNLLGVSEVVSSLNRIWENEPQEFIVFVGKGISSNSNLRRRWVEATVNLIAP